MKFVSFVKSDIKLKSQPKKLTVTIGRHKDKYQLDSKTMKYQPVKAYGMKKRASRGLGWKDDRGRKKSIDFEEIMEESNRKLGLKKEDREKYNKKFKGREGEKNDSEESFVRDTDDEGSEKKSPRSAKSGSDNEVEEEAENDDAFVSLTRR